MGIPWIGPGYFLKIHSKSEVGSEIARIYVRYDNVERLQTCRSGNSIRNVPPPASLWQRYRIIITTHRE